MQSFERAKSRIGKTGCRSSLIARSVLPTISPTMLSSKSFSPRRWLPSMQASWTSPCRDTRTWKVNGNFLVQTLLLHGNGSSLRSKMPIQSRFRNWWASQNRCAYSGRWDIYRKFRLCWMLKRLFDDWIQQKPRVLTASGLSCSKVMLHKQHEGSTPWCSRWAFDVKVSLSWREDGCFLCLKDGAVHRQWEATELFSLNQS